MPTPFRAFPNPLPEHRDFLSFQLLFGFGRRHDFVGIAGNDPGDQRAFLWVAGDQNGAAFAGGLRVFLLIETQPRLALVPVGSVALIAMFGKDGLNVAAEGDFASARSSARQSQSQHQGEREAKEACLMDIWCHDFWDDSRVFEAVEAIKQSIFFNPTGDES
jgi:hypothetical protein